MKRVYWRPSKVSRASLLWIGVVAVGGTMLAEGLPIRQPGALDQKKHAAAELAARSMRFVREARLARELPVDAQFDPAHSGLIGAAMTPVTTLPAHLEEKQSSVNPNFAAVVVDMLAQAGVEPGDRVAVGYSGSYPALNICLCAAMATMDVQPIIVHSAGASQFGANHPDMLWLDMERALYDGGLIPFRSQAATLGGYGDRARGMSAESQAMLRAAIDRNDVAFLEVKTLGQSIRRRMRLYDRLAAGAPIKAYVNVGGGAASIRGGDGKQLFGVGVSKSPPPGAGDVDCVATRFAAAGTPVIHLGNAMRLARRYGFPVAPRQMPQVGSVEAYAAVVPSRLLAAAALLVIVLSLRVTVFMGWLQLAAANLLRNKLTWRPNEAVQPLGAAATAELMI